MDSEINRYKLEEVFGIREIPLDDCPTYVIRKAHKSFEYCVNHETQHIVVYGASRQGKSWLVERFCPSFIRVGCDTKFSRDSIFKAILHELGVKVGSISDSATRETGGSLEASAKGELAIPLVAKGQAEGKGKLDHKRSHGSSMSYVNIDLQNHSEVITEIKNVYNNKFIVIENFHYLDPTVQKAFASSLREFLYHGIRVIIVGVWKETTKLTSMVSDLTNRVESIDIGNWNKDELREIVDLGNTALNIRIHPDVSDLFIENSGFNVGIFKSLLKNYCKLHTVYETQENTMELTDMKLAEEAISASYNEVVIPAIDRIHKLAKMKSGSKGLRYYIVRALLDLITEYNLDEILQGIELDAIVKKIESYNEEVFQQSNIKQELMVLHLRDETIDAEGSSNGNFIPLFYYDQIKNCIFVVESAMLVAHRSKEIDLSQVLGPKTHYVK